MGVKTLRVNVPTMAEAGLQGFEAYTWSALLVPKGTPRDIVERLNREVNKALSGREIRARLAELGVEIEGASTPESTGQFIREEMLKWAPIVKASGAVVE